MKNKWYYLILIIVLTGCFNGNNSILMNIPFNPEKLDPQKTLDSNSKFILSHIFEGLTTEDAKGKVVPAVAESWKVEGAKWTFYINPQAKWQNGKKVKAQDFVTAWERVISPINENENATKMFMIKNAMEYNQSKVSFDYVGLKAVDERTLVVELNEEISNFDSLVAQTIFYPLNTEFYESHGKNYGVGKKNILGNGPYKISKWKNAKRITLDKSKEYTNKEKIKINEINLVINEDSKKLEKMFEKNEIQIVNLPITEITKYLKSNEKKDFKLGEITFVEFNRKIKLFSNAKIRKAISQALNRDMLESGLEKMIMKAETFNLYTENNKTSYRPEEAKEIFREGLNELEIEFNELNSIDLLIRANEFELAIANFIKKQLYENLNLDVQISAKTSQSREQAIGREDYQLTLGNSWLGVNNIEQYLKERDSSVDGVKFWENEVYSNLIEKAMKEKDYNKKIELLHESDNILMNEMPVIPLTFSKKSFLIKNNIKNIRLSNLTGELDFRYATIEK